MSRSRMNLKRSVAYTLVLLLCNLLVLQSTFAQQPGVKVTVYADEGFGLKIKVEEGDAASSPVKFPTAGPKILVQDANNMPVQGALVVFTAPESGSGGFFEGGTRSLTVTTDREGRAVAAGYQANAVAGTYEIQVHTQYLNETVDTVVTHTNVAPSKSSKKMITIIAIAGAGAAGAILAASGKGGSGSSTQTPTLPTITFGGSTVGAPAP
jgi:hypothetical protein